MSPAAIRQDLAGAVPVGPPAMFRALRMRTEALAYEPDAVVNSLLALPELAAPLGR